MGGWLSAQVKGLFWNYFSIGLDAEAAYGFHSLREKRPWAAPSRMINQGWYSYFSCTTGWFCCNAPPVRNKVILKVRPLTSPKSLVFVPMSSQSLLYRVLKMPLFMIDWPMHSSRVQGR